MKRPWESVTLVPVTKPVVRPSASRLKVAASNSTMPTFLSGSPSVAKARPVKAAWLGVRTKLALLTAPVVTVIASAAVSVSLPNDHWAA